MIIPHIINDNILLLCSFHLLRFCSELAQHKICIRWNKMGRQKKNAGQIEKLEEMANKGKQLHLNSYIQLHDIFN